ncbi:MAG: AAA domain-containing protein [Clostridia bacterium]|nr:AAA domain-containing protein [Clostridia bacterium]
MEILKKYINQSVLRILCSNDESKKYTKHFRSILIDVTPYINDGVDYYRDEISRRYYKDTIEINDKKYIISNDWYYKTHNDLDNRTPYLNFIKDVIKDAIRIKGGRNLIYYGVPGTGKSYAIDQLLNDVKDENKFRITFHPEYTYNDFTGQLLPTVIKEGENKDNITYSFKKGPFTLALEKAYDTPQESVYLIIEEMSRGNCAAIFGDIFQLLDRVKDGDRKDWSRYFVNNEVISKDITLIKDDRIKIPSNMYILGTVNTSDQNVFVMDTAFKRRFEWKYITTKPVPEEKPYFNSIDISLNNGNDTIQVNWIDLYGVLNKFISSSEKLGLGEDKQIGQFFIEFDGKNDKEKIRNKLLHYLWFDIQEATYKTEIKLFDDSITSFSDLYDKYENNEKIFSDDFFESIEAWNNNSL